MSVDAPSDAKPATPAPALGRLGTAAAWTAAVCCLPYLVLKVIWTLGTPVGLTDRSLLHSSGWVSSNALMAVVQLAGLLLVLALVRPWGRRLPAWLLVVPVWVGTGLLFQVAVGAVLLAVFSPAAQATSGSTGGIESWVFGLVYASFAVQGAALAVAFACYARARWGRLLGRRTGEVLPAQTAPTGSWPANHLAGMAQAVAGMAVAVAVVYAYWAAGGSFGLAATQPHPSAAMQATRAAGAVIAAVGLLGLAGRWGQQTRLWLPVVLTWVGSSALAAFDGFTFALNRLFVLGTDVSVPGWTLADTALVIEVVIGVLAAAVGALAVSAAAKDHRKPAPTGAAGARPAA